MNEICSVFYFAVAFSALVGGTVRRLIGVSLLLLFFFLLGPRFVCSFRISVLPRVPRSAYTSGKTLEAFVNCCSFVNSFVDVNSSVLGESLLILALSIWREFLILASSICLQR